MISKRKVLVIDDSQVQREQIKKLLEDMAFQVIEAEDGERGLEQIRENEDLCLIFCDVNMPKMDGLALLEAYRQECLEKDELQYVPVIMLTTETDRNSIYRGKSAGAAGWLVKPAKEDHISKLVNVFAG